MYGILRALSDEPINRQRQKRSFRLICRLSIQHIRCVEQRSAYRCLHSVLRARPGKTLHRTVLFPRLRVPFDLTKHRGTQRVPLCLVPVVGLSAQIVLCLHSVLRARTAFSPRPGKTLHRTVLFPRLRVPFDLTKHRGTQRVPLCLVPVVGLSAQIVLCLHSVLRARTAFSPRPGKTLHRTVLFPRLRVPFDLTKHRGTQRVPLCLVRVVIQHFSKNTVISMVLGHPNSEITCIPPS